MIDSRTSLGPLKKDSSLRAYFEKIESFSSLIEKDIRTLNRKDYPERCFFKISGKKTHEILSLTPHIEQLKQKHALSEMIDIGGGQGHTSRVISTYHDLSCKCIDCNKDFQKTGLEKLDKYPNYKNGKGLKYYNFTLGSDKKEISNLFNQKTLSLGLHTCGPLAIEHINHFINSNSPSMINLGCCYLRMNPLTDLNISKYGQNHCQININKYALTLASRSHSFMDRKNFELKRRVKRYRNTLHLLLHEKFNFKNFHSVGDANPRSYWGDFYDYAIERAKYMNLDFSISKREVDDFYNQKRIKQLAQTMFHADLIRWRLGRALELTILIDRALKLQESGCHIKLIEIFDETISPRNIGIIASR